MLAEVLFFDVPALFVIGTIISLILFLKCPKEDAKKRSARKIVFFIFAGISASLVTGAVVLICLLMAAISNM